MEKIQVLAFIKSQLADGSITLADLAELNPGVVATTTSLESGPVAVVSGGQKVSSKNLINVFYGIGAIIVLAGVVILVQQNWTEIGFIGRFLVTLGIAAATYAGGLVARGPGQRVMSQALFTIAAVLSPLGSYVVLAENNLQFTLLYQIFVAVALATLFAFAWLVSKRNILFIYVTFFLTWVYYASLLKFFKEIITTSPHLLTWATIVVGVSYIALGRWYTVATDSEGMREASSVKTLLYGFGTLGLLGAGISLGGVWDLVYIPVVFGTFYASVFLRSRAMLILAGLFLIGHLIHLTAKYFLTSIGWPVSLVISGFLIIGIGYATFYMNKKYIHQ